MPCLSCGNTTTCKAHIQPAAIGKDITKRSGGKTPSLLAPNQHRIQVGGLFDDNILCSKCDGKLGVFDDHAIAISRLLGTLHEVIDHRANRFTITYSDRVNHQQLALFGAAVAWRASVSKICRDLSGFTLGKNEAWFRDMIFRRNNEIPTVLIARIVGGNPISHEAAMTMLSYPVKIKIRGISLARFYVRGMMFLIQTTRNADASLLADAVTTFGGGAGLNCLTGSLMPFEKLGDLPQVEKSKYIQHVLSS